MALDGKIRMDLWALPMNSARRGYALNVLYCDVLPGF
jgi:hypothetical protein